MQQKRCTVPLLYCCSGVLLLFKVYQVEGDSMEVSHL